MGAFSFDVWEEVGERCQWYLAPPIGGHDRGDALRGDVPLECSLGDAKQASGACPINRRSDHEFEVAAHRGELLGECRRRLLHSLEGRDVADQALTIHPTRYALRTEEVGYSDTLSPAGGVVDPKRDADRLRSGSPTLWIGAGASLIVRQRRATLVRLGRVCG